MNAEICIIYVIYICTVYAPICKRAIEEICTSMLLYHDASIYNFKMQKYADYMQIYAK